MSNDIVVFYIRMFIDSNKVTKGHDTSNAISYTYKDVKKVYEYVDNKGNCMVMASDPTAQLFADEHNIMGDEMALPFDMKGNITMVNSQQSKDESIKFHALMMWVDKCDFDIARNQVENFVIYQKSGLHGQILKNMDLDEMLDYSSKRREAWDEEKASLGIRQ